MTISQDTSAPLIVVVGATGGQGGSVIKALAESDKPYRVRGFTRDTSKPAAQELAKKGVEMVVIDPKPTTENKEKVFKAFEGATYAFAVTIPSIVDNKEREVAEGKMFADAAKAAKLELLVWSGLENYTELSGGKYTHVEYFDGKAEVTQYCKDIGIPFVNVEAAGYMQNYLSFSAPRKQADGSFTFFAPTSPDSSARLIDTDGDYGLWVRKAIEEWPAGSSEILTCADTLTRAQIAETIAEVTGKTINCVQVSEEQFLKGMVAAGRSENVARQAMEMFLCIAEFGYYGKKDIGPSLKGLARKPRTFVEFVKANKEEFEKILA